MHSNATSGSVNIPKCTPNFLFFSATSAVQRWILLRLMSLNLFFLIVSYNSNSIHLLIWHKITHSPKKKCKHVFFFPPSPHPFSLSLRYVVNSQIRVLDRCILCNLSECPITDQLNLVSKSTRNHSNQQLELMLISIVLREADRLRRAIKRLSLSGRVATCRALN